MGFARQSLARFPPYDRHPAHISNRSRQPDTLGSLPAFRVGISPSLQSFLLADPVPVLLRSRGKIRVGFAGIFRI